MAHQWPEGQAGRELRRMLAPGEWMLGWQQGRGGAVLVATDQRAIIIKPGRWYRPSSRTLRAWPYRQINRVDLHTTARAGWVEIVTDDQRATDHPDDHPADHPADQRRDKRVDFDGADNWFRPLVALLCERLARVKQAEMTAETADPDDA